MTDADAAELVERLLTAAAMVMEDANEAALIKGTQGLEARLAATVVAGQDIEVLAKAATVIARRWT